MVTPADYVCSNNLISANFLNLPSRSLQDYYRVIKRPVSLKSLYKTVQGIKGRDPATGSSLMKSWDSFENEVGYIWRNAREYNEDGSAIVELAEELRVSHVQRCLIMYTPLTLGIRNISRNV